MIVYRLSKSLFSNNLTGKGAEKTGGRWNSKGTALLYTGESRALCTAEAAVHIPLGSIPEDYVMISIEIPDGLPVEEILKENLEMGWNSFPHSHTTQKLGDEFVSRNQALVLKVPSAVVQGDYNYLLNPAHSDFNRVKVVEIVPFSFDQRLFRR